MASNDGYLLQYFKEKGIPVLGIEPARNVAQAAIDKGIPTVTSFFGRTLARELASDGNALISFWETMSWLMFPTLMTSWVA